MTQGTATYNPIPSKTLRTAADDYEQLAASYDDARFASRFGQYELSETRLLIRDILPRCGADDLASWRALDLATGTGKVAITLAAMGGQVTALDAAHAMLERCKLNARAAGVENNIQFVRGSADDVPLAANSLDFIFSFRFLHLLQRREYAVVLRECARLLKPGGYLILEVKNPWYGLGLYKIKDFQRRRKGETKFSSYVSPVEARAVVEQDGLSLTYYTGLLLPRAWTVSELPIAASVCRGLARGPLKMIASHLVLVCRKPFLSA